MENNTLRIDYDDDALTIMENVNKALVFYGLEFRRDGLHHDGYVIYSVVPTPPFNSPPFLGCEKEKYSFDSIYQGFGFPRIYSDGLTPETVARLEKEKAA